MKYIVVRGINFVPEGADAEKRLEPGDSADELNQTQLGHLLRRGAVANVKSKRSKKVSADA